MKLKNKLKMFEEFTSAEKNTETTIDSKGAVTTPSNTTSILDDVDNILGNLETLSKQIDENIDEAIDSITNDFLNNALNEATAGEMMMQMFKDMGAAAKLGASYKKMAATKASIDTDKKVFALKFAEEKPEKVEVALDKIKDKLNDAIKAEKDPAKKQRLRMQRDKKLETLKTQVSAKIDREKQDKDKKFDRDSADAQSAITKLLGDNKITSPIMSARWEAQKLTIDRNIEDANIEAERNAWDEFIEDEDRIKRLEADQLERSKKDAKEADERLAQAKADAEEAQAELDDKIANAQGDEKDALDKLKEFNDAYLDFSDKMNLTKESTSEEKKAASDASTRFINADQALSKKTMKDAFGYEDDVDASNALAEFNERAEELKSKYKAIKAEAGVRSSDDEEDDSSSEPDPADDGGEERTAEQIQQEIDDLDQQITDKEADLDSKREEMQNSEAGQEYARVQSEYDSLRSTPEADRADDHQEQLQALEDQMDQIEQDFRENDSLGQAMSTLESEIESLKDQRTEKQQELRDLPQESFNYENVTESYAFKSGSIADRFKRLL